MAEWKIGLAIAGALCSIGNGSAALGSFPKQRLLEVKRRRRIHWIGATGKRTGEISNFKLPLFVKHPKLGWSCQINVLRLLFMQHLQTSQGGMKKLKELSWGQGIASYHSTRRILQILQILQRENSLMSDESARFNLIQFVQILDQDSRQKKSLRIENTSARLEVWDPIGDPIWMQLGANKCCFNKC